MREFITSLSRSFHLTLFTVCLFGGLLLTFAKDKAQKVPGISLVSLRDGSMTQLDQFQGKVVLLDFWASWCLPCKKTLPAVEAIQTKHPQLVLLTISIDDDKNNAQRFMELRKLKAVVLHDGKKLAASTFGIQGMPSAVLIDSRGMIRRRFDGYTESMTDEMEEEVVKLLAEGQPHP